MTDQAIQQQQNYSKMDVPVAHILRVGLDKSWDLPQYGWQLRCMGTYSNGTPFWQFDHHTHAHGNWVLTATSGRDGLEYVSGRACWRSGETVRPKA